MTPLSGGHGGIEIKSGAVIDGRDSPWARHQVSVLYLLQILARNASEASFISGGMVLVTDAAAPHGSYLWLPEGAYPDNFNLP